MRVEMVWHRLFFPALRCIRSQQYPLKTRHCLPPTWFLFCLSLSPPLSLSFSISLFFPPILPPFFCPSVYLSLFLSCPSFPFFPSLSFSFPLSPGPRCTHRHVHAHAHTHAHTNLHPCSHTHTHTHTCAHAAISALQLFSPSSLWQPMSSALRYTDCAGIRLAHLQAVAALSICALHQCLARA